VSHRREQVASTLQRAVQQVIAKGLQDPRISGMITVTAVEVSPDLKAATVLVSILPADRERLTMHGLRDAASHIRRQTGDLVDMRQVPELTFRLDSSLKKQADVYTAIAKVTAERERAAAEGAAGAAPESENPPSGADEGGSGDKQGEVGA
jgi:ribosome-binding factor A